MRATVGEIAVVENAVRWARPRAHRDRASRALAWFAGAVALVTATGLLSFCYPATLAAVRPGLMWVHEYAGDAAIVLSGVYLAWHLPRVWSLRRRAISWWTGIATAACWLASAATGVVGQFTPLGAALWILHAVASAAFVVLACVHGVWGFRARRGERNG